MLLVWGVGQRCHCIISCWHLLMGPLFLRLKATLFRFQRSVGDVLIGAAMDCRCEGSHRTEGQYFYGSNVCSTSLVRLDTACLFGRLLSASWHSTPIKDFQKLKLCLLPRLSSSIQSCSEVGASTPRLQISVGVYFNGIGIKNIGSLM